MRLRLACWIRKVTSVHVNAHAHVHTYAHAPTYSHTQKYVLLVSFPQQKWFRERAKVLRYTYIACLVFHFAVKA
jgi:hypothetical protein